MNFLDALDRFLEHQGTVKGLLILAVAFLWWRNDRKQKEQLDGKDAEIRRLAADVHDMRNRMRDLWDKRYGISVENEKEKGQ